MTDPVAFQLGPLSIRWYGVFVALGFLAGYHVAQRRGRALGLDPRAASDMTLAAMLGGIVGARALYVVENWGEEFSGRLLDAFAVWHGGLVFYGGLAGALAAVTFWSWQRRWPLPDVGDMMAPALPLGHALGRIGCLLNGCCFGRPWHGPLAVTYPGLTHEGLPNGPLYMQRLLGWVPPDAVDCIPLFPVQAVEAAANLGLCLVLLHLGRRRVWRRQLFALYLLGYSALRFAVEFGRGDYLTRPGGLTSAQWLCLALSVAAVAWLAWNRHARPGFQPEDARTHRPDGRP